MADDRSDTAVLIEALTSLPGALHTRLTNMRHCYRIGDIHSNMSASRLPGEMMKKVDCKNRDNDTRGPEAANSSADFFVAGPAPSLPEAMLRL